MSALDAFLATWAKARDTFGSGEPQPGDQFDKSAGNSTGPMVNLAQHHDVGAGDGAFAPFDTGGWNPDFDVRIPLPSTEFGQTTNPPITSSIPLPAGVTHL